MHADAPARSGGTIDDLIRAGARALAQSPTPMIDARLLVGHVLGLSREALIAEGRRAVEGQHRESLLHLIARRQAGEPIAYLVGQQEFWSLPFHVGPGVLVPRSDTETLIEAVCARRPDRKTAHRIVDLGTGSGCILAALLHEYPYAEGMGVDRSATALSYARRNLDALGLSARCCLLQGAWLAPLRSENAVSILAANPPYIVDQRKTAAGRADGSGGNGGNGAGLPTGLSPDVERYEPAEALFAGVDGCDAYRAILNAAPAVMAPGGLIALEIGFDQKETVMALTRGAFPDADLSCVNDLEGRHRVILAEIR